MIVLFEYNGLLLTMLSIKKSSNLSPIKQVNHMLQTQVLRVRPEKESCIRVNTRELDRELCTR